MVNDTALREQNAMRVLQAERDRIDVMSQRHVQGLMTGYTDQRTYDGDMRDFVSPDSIFQKMRKVVDNRYFESISG